MRTLRQSVLILLFLFLPLSLFGREKPSSSSKDQSGYALLRPSLFSSHLRFLSSDLLEGRETGKQGQKLAANYISSVFERLGLKPMGDSGTYFQKFFVRERWVGMGSQIAVHYSSNGTTAAESLIWDVLFKHFYFFPRQLAPSADTVRAGVVFAGYGINDSAVYHYSDYAGLDAKGKIVVVLGGEPQEQDSASIFNGLKPTRWSNPTTKRVAAAEAGALVLLIVADRGNRPPVAEQSEGFRESLTSSSMSLIQPNAQPVPAPLPVVFISTDVASSLIASSGKTISQLQAEIDRTCTPHSLAIEGISAEIFLDVHEDTLVSENVCGLLEGGDKNLKNEVVIFSAHYDHLGIASDGDVYNGADDNASGTSGILGLAEAFSRNPQKPRRSILFMLFSGEEKGLLGSKFYTDYPAVPLSRTFANINMDMIGRLDPKYEKLKDPNYIYVIGSDKISPELDRILKQENTATVGLTLDYTYNDDNEPN
ncbi:MAG: M28 family peptidase, partial [Chlorobiales bacterium]|nr:M28 family peptidase [Chlorobiales bacterium]